MNDYIFFEENLEWDANSDTVNSKIIIPSYLSRDYKSLVGYIFYIKGVVGSIPIPSKPGGSGSPLEQVVRYSIGYKKLSIDHLSDVALFQSSTNSYIDLGIVENYESDPSYPLWSQKKYPLIDHYIPFRGLNDDALVKDLRFEFQPESSGKYTPNIEVKTIDLCFLPKDGYRYLLNPLFRDKSIQKRLRVSGSKIVLGDTLRAPAVGPTAKDGIGYFTLKFELGNIQLPISQTSDKSYDVAEPSVLVSAPCPPLWIPPSYSTVITNMSEIEYFDKFNVFKNELLKRSVN